MSLMLSGFDALPACRASKVLAYAQENKAVIIAELERKEVAYGELLHLAKKHGLCFWFSAGGREGTPIYEPGQFAFGLVTSLWMTASPLQYQRYKELLSAIVVTGTTRSGGCWWR